MMDLLKEKSFSCQHQQRWIFPVDTGHVVYQGFWAFIEML